MTQLFSKFTFFKAGQGMFYGGQIFDNSKKQAFTVVYDCGTTLFIKGNSKSLNKEINKFKKSNYFNSNKTIDLLFISHLDYDHVSGLKRLLTEFKVKNIILPYIGKKHRQFFLCSMSDDNEDKLLNINDYISFIDSPNQFILEASENTKIFFVKPNDKNEVEYQDPINTDNYPENIYPRGTENNDQDELTGQENVVKYNNDLQFFIKSYWEFTTYCKAVNQSAIDKLEACLKIKLKINQDVDLSFDVLKELLIENRTEAHSCYKKHMNEINSHGLVLFHGPINIKSIKGKMKADCSLAHFRYCTSFFNLPLTIDSCNTPVLGTLLLGDTSLNPENNPIDFPKAFKQKIKYVHIMQVPHHGSSKNWNLDKYNELEIGGNLNIARQNFVSVCNFGYGNRYGHPFHQVLNDLSSTIFLNSQFSSLSICYEISNK